MARKIGMWDGMVYGHEVGEYGKRNGYLDYGTLAEIVGDMVLCNDIVGSTYEFAEWELVNGTDYDEEDDYYYDIYQYYIIGPYGAEFLEKHTDQIVWYSEELDLHVWGITHFGTAWSYVLTDIELVECETLDELIEVNERSAA